MIAIIKKGAVFVFQYRKIFYNALIIFLLLHAAHQEKVSWYALLDILVSLPLAGETCRIILEQVKALKHSNTDLTKEGIEDSHTTDEN